MSGEATDAAPAESVAPARSTLAQAVIAVRQERDLLQSALAEERGAHADTALQLEAARAQLIEERELTQEEIESAVSDFTHIAAQAEARASAAEARASAAEAALHRLTSSTAMESAMRESDAELQRRTEIRQDVAPACTTGMPAMRDAEPQPQPSAEQATRTVAAVGAQLLASRRARVEAATAAAQRVAQASYARENHFSHLVTAAAAAAASSELSISEAVQTVQRPPPPPPPSPPIGASRLVGRRSISSGSLPALTGGDAVLGLPAPQGWRPSTPTEPPSASRAGWVQFGEQVDAWTQPHTGAGAPPGWVTF